MFNSGQRNEKRRELARARSTLTPRPVDFAIVAGALLVVILLPAGATQPTPDEKVFEPPAESLQLSCITPMRAHARRARLTPGE